MSASDDADRVVAPNLGFLNVRCAPMRSRSKLDADDATARAHGYRDYLDACGMTIEDGDAAED